MTDLHELSITVQTLIEQINALRDRFSDRNALIAFLCKLLAVDQETGEYLTKMREPRYHHGEHWKLSYEKTLFCVRMIAPQLKGEVDER